MLAQLLIMFGIIINGIGTLSYVVGTLRGKIRPNKVTFFVWSIAPFVAYLAQISQHVGVQALMTLSVSIFPMSVFLASFLNKQAYWQLNKRDVVCGLLSLAGLLLWYLTKVSNVAIAFSLLSEGLATLPTAVKAYHYPRTEQAWPWLASTISGVLTLVTITTWNFAHFAFPMLYAGEMLIIFLFVQFEPGYHLGHKLSTS
jgi:hypothetical protein